MCPLLAFFSIQTSNYKVLSPTELPDLANKYLFLQSQPTLFLSIYILPGKAYPWLHHSLCGHVSKSLSPALFPDTHAKKSSHLLDIPQTPQIKCAVSSKPAAPPVSLTQYTVILRGRSTTPLAPLSQLVLTSPKEEKLIRMCQI